MVQGARCVKDQTVSDVFGLQQGEKILVELDERDCPNNYAGYLLGAFLADLARTGTESPIHIQRWDNPAFHSYKKSMMKTVEKKFKFHINGRSWVLDKLHEAWRAHKTTLKGKYFDGKPSEDVLKNVPKEVEATQWSSLVSVWNTNHKKKESQTNSENARKQVHYHTGGRKCIARKQKEMINEMVVRSPIGSRYRMKLIKGKTGLMRTKQQRKKCLRHVISSRPVLLV